jgi:hypothetical protein
LILTPANLDVETTAAIPYSENTLLNLHRAPPFIQLPQGDNDVLESWNVEDIRDLDLLPCFVEECHNPAAFDWDH